MSNKTNMKEDVMKKLQFQIMKTDLGSDGLHAID